MNTSTLHGKKIFLVDAIGAIVSATSLLIPYIFEDVFGMPKIAITGFFCIAIFCSIYSGSVYLSNVKNWRPFLSLIALINMAYCLYTLYHLFHHAKSISALGYAYFIGEILIILSLSVFELNVSRSKVSPAAQP